MSASALRKNLWVICAGLSFPLATWADPILAPADDSFYTPPAVSAGNHGDLIWYRPTTINLGGGVPPVQAWNVMYRSTDSVGASNFVTGTNLHESHRSLSDWDQWHTGKFNCRSPGFS